jgi:hypothetical protein
MAILVFSILIGKGLAVSRNPPIMQEAASDPARDVTGL